MPIEKIEETFRNRTSSISIEDSVLGVVFALFGFAVFAPETTIQIAGENFANWGLEGSIASLGAMYATNKPDLQNLDELEIGAVGGTGLVILGNEYITQINDFIFGSPEMQWLALAITFAGAFVVMVK